MPSATDITVRAGPLRILLMWAIRACRRRKSVPSCLRRRRQRIALRQAPAHASRAAPSTTTAALVVARGAARPDIPTPVRLLSMRRRARRHFQISSRNAANSIAATRAACRRMGPRWRWPLDNLYCITCITTRRHRRALGLFHNLNLERRQVLGHDRLEGAAPRSPAQRHAPQRAM